ncbi:hypothetical protein NUU61_009196 [Penicillium alfredii]|uniref:tRNA-splicing endonuclease subunit Sen15 domain-containing protein n=1 Tax=Penicillium alfredii TaxID=1506179 RepID=A0A9W9JXG7_9EURO|nr:uncharacterized protein NUU61_009196 [Penicillium alfredii]KAJ5084617.1 hypothetical protein NUU61_009196 [Penicillium alfredii]
MPSTQEDPAPPKLSSLSQLISAASASENPLAATTIQILHNLRHQHLWTSLQIHDLPAHINTPKAPGTIPHGSPLDSTTQKNNNILPTSLISGIPPHRVYTHPDEQLYMLEKGLHDDDLRQERLFVIPTAQGQPWSLHRMAAVFDSLAEIRVTDDGAESRTEQSVDPDKASKLAEYYYKKEQVRATGEWGGKRLLLAMVDRGLGGEGTVVYYVVQEGEVKPRQN